MISQLPEVPSIAAMKTKYKDNHWGTSLQKLPWDNKNERSPIENLISSTMTEWYNAKHRETSNEELELINSIIPLRCHHCMSKSIIRFGKCNNGILRYKCKNCNRTFTNLTNTIFDSHKIPISEWFEYLIHLFEFHSIKTSSRDNKNASSTGIYWLKKIFKVLNDIQKDVILSGDIYFDEIFFSTTKSNTILKDGKKLRGISRNKLCVAVAIDNSNNIVILCENTSKPSLKSTYTTMKNHIKPGSTLIHDSEHSHSILVSELNLKSVIYSTKETKKLEDKDNPLDPINDLHSYIRDFMKSHGGYNRSSLQDYMNLIWFILSKPDNRYEKLRLFIEMAVNTLERAKYRDSMKKILLD